MKVISLVISLFVCCNDIMGVEVWLIQRCRNWQSNIFGHKASWKVFQWVPFILQERLASVYQELGDESLSPVPFKILIEHPLIQDIIQACTSYKALVSLFSVHNTIWTSDQHSGPDCSKLTTSLVNVSLKFQTLLSNICQYFLLKKCEKLLQCKSFSHFFNKKYQFIWL